MTDDFQNLSIQPSDLPQVKSAEFHQIERGYLKVTLLSSGAFFLVLMIAAFCIIFFSDEIMGTTMEFGITLGSIGFLWLLNIIVSLKAFPKKKYALRERDILFTLPSSKEQFHFKGKDYKGHTDFLRFFYKIRYK